MSNVSQVDRAVRTQTQTTDIWMHWLRLGALAGALAAAGNLATFGLLTLAGVALLVPAGAPGSALQPLGAFPVILMSVVPALVGTALLAGLSRLTAHALRVFQLGALGFMLLSLGGPLALPVSLPVQLGLAAMHVIAAGAIVAVLSAGAARRPA